MLDITDDVKFDNRIIRSEFHTHQPYSTLTFAPSDEIKIAIRQQDVCTLPSESYIFLEGSLTKADDSAPDAVFINNAFAFLFDEIRYEIGGVEIDRVRNCGITTTLKGYCSFSPTNVKNLEHAGWFTDNTSHVMNKTNGDFSAVIPLKILLGFAEDYDKVIVQMQQELILIRSKNDINVIKVEDDKTYKLTLKKVSWCVPYVTLSDEEKLQIYKVIKNDEEIVVPFRSWELFEFPSLPKTTVHNWTVKTTAGLEKPRYVIVGFQSDRKNVLNKDMSKFDHCDVNSVRVWLNSEYYPYETLNVDYSKNNHVIFYEQYRRFKQSYYGEQGQSMLGFEEFTSNAPIIVIDCSKQNESIKTGNIDIRIEIQSSKNFPDKTTVFALIINDKIIEYTPSKNIVRKI